MRPAENPFNSGKVDALPYNFDSTDWQEVFADLRALDFRGSVVGGHGSGKTTFLRELADKLRSRGFVVFQICLKRDRKHLRFAEWRQLCFKSGEHTIVLIDGAEQLSTLEWCSVALLSRRARGLIVSAHRLGLLPPLLMCNPCVKTVRQLVNALAPSMVASDLVENVYSSHRGNVREVFRTLYDRFAHDNSL